MQPNIENRIRKLREILVELKLDAAVLLTEENRRYFSNFYGSSGAIIISLEDAVLYTDSRYIAQATELASNYYKVIEHTMSLYESVTEYLQQKNIKNMGIEGTIFYQQFLSLQAAVDNELIVLDSEIMSLRNIKDEYEINCIQRGIQLCDQAFYHILNVIRPGVTEKEIAIELDYFMIKNGAEKVKNFTVVASGERASIPHAEPTDRVINNGDMVKMDIGAVVDGYYSDFARTVVVGEPSEKQKEIYRIVNEALDLSLEYVGPGKTAAEVDHVGRSHISAEGYGDNFRHGLGHTVGLNIHDSIVLRSTNHAVLQPGMVTTLEPGIYIPGWGGVRIEDIVLITEDGCRNLTSATKELQIISTESRYIEK